MNCLAEAARAAICPTSARGLKKDVQDSGKNLEKMLCSDRPKGFDLFDLSKTSRAIS